MTRRNVLPFIGLIVALGAPTAAFAQSLSFTQETPSATCGQCHQEQYAQWSTGSAEGKTTDAMAVVGGGTARASVHALTWQDALFRDEAAAMGDPTMCQRCHLPTTAFDAGHSRGIYAPVSRGTNAANAADGVACVTCHLGNDGIIHVAEGARSGLRHTGRIAEDEHEVRDDPWMGTSEFCATCHQDRVFGSFTDTFAEWESGPLTNKTCQDCHMQDEGHAWPGGHSPQVRAAGLAVAVPTAGTTGATFRVGLRNLHAGHNAPTGDTFRSYLVRVTVKDGAGAVVVSKDVGVAPPIQTPIFSAIEVRDRLDPVPAGGERQLDLGVLPAGTYTVTTALSYQLTREVTLQYPRKQVPVEPSPELAVGTWTDRLTVCASASPCAAATILHDPGQGF